MAREDSVRIGLRLGKDPMSATIFPRVVVPEAKAADLIMIKVGAEMVHEVVVTQIEEVVIMAGEIATMVEMVVIMIETDEITTEVVVIILEIQEIMTEELVSMTVVAATMTEIPPVNTTDETIVLGITHLGIILL